MLDPNDYNFEQQSIVTPKFSNPRSKFVYDTPAHYDSNRIEINKSLTSATSFLSSMLFRCYNILHLIISVITIIYQPQGHIQTVSFFSFLLCFLLPPPTLGQGDLVGILELFNVSRTILSILSPWRRLKPIIPHFMPKEKFRSNSWL